MLTRLTNLLPQSRLRAIRKQYFLRLATVVLVLLSAVFIVHGLLLVPSYLFADEQADRGSAELAALNERAASAEMEEVRTRTAALDTSAKNLLRLESIPRPSAALRAVLAVPRPGIALTGFTYTAPNGSNAAKMGVTGTAISRDALRRYAAALGTLPFVSTADLPISAYAEESNIEFTITLSGTLTP